MSAIALDRPLGDEDLAVAAPGTISVRVLTDLAAAEPEWRQLEAAAILTPYQRYDWIRHLLAARDEPTQVAIVVLEQAGQPIALLPLEITYRLGAQCATLIGTDIGNADWMIALPSAIPLLTLARLQDAVSVAAKKVGGIDLVLLRALPATWNGAANPLLAFPHQPGPDHLFRGALNTRGTFDRFDEKRIANFARRKRKLSAAHGEVSFRRARNIAEIESIHRAFLEHRGARFAQMGIANIFAEPRFVKLFHDGAVAALGKTEPAIVMHGLYAGEQIIATAIGSIARGHYTQYINATAGGDVAKHRLIGTLMHELFTEVAAAGVTSIDMGLGDFDYKTDWTAPETVYDGVIPMTLRGRVAGSVILGVRRLKRTIKQHDRLWTLARQLRGMLARRTSAPPARDG